MPLVHIHERSWIRRVAKHKSIPPRSTNRLNNGRNIHSSSLRAVKPLSVSLLLLRSPAVPCRSLTTAPLTVYDTRRCWHLSSLSLRAPHHRAWHWCNESSAIDIETCTSAVLTGFSCKIDDPRYRRLNQRRVRSAEISPPPRISSVLSDAAVLLSDLTSARRITVQVHDYGIRSYTCIYTCVQLRAPECTCLQDARLRSTRTSRVATQTRIVARIYLFTSTSHIRSGGLISGTLP